MAQRERSGPLTEAELEALAAAADDLGDRVVRALAEETERNPDDFDIDPSDYEFPVPDVGEGD